MAAFSIQAWRVGSLIAASTGEWFIDWATYSRAVSRLFTGEPIYPAEQLGGPYNLIAMSGSGYAYPPASVVLMAPFAPAVIGLLLWEIFIVGTFVSAIWVVIKRGFPSKGIEAFGIALLGTALFFPAMEGIVAGNVNMVTAGLLGWAWAGLPRPGMASGVVGVLKVFPAAIAVLYGWRATVVAALTMVVIAVVTLPIVGMGAWRDFSVAIRDSVPSCPFSVTNLSFACLFEPSIGLDAAKILSLVVAALLVLVAAVTGPTMIGVMSIGAAIMLPATDLHIHYWSMVLVLLFVAIARIARRRRGEFPDPAATPFASRWGFGSY